MTDNGQTHETDNGCSGAGASNSLARIADIDVGPERRARRIAERYAPACVITDENFRILHASGRIGRYVEPTAAAATLDLLNLVHRGLRHELRTALSRAREINEATHAERISLAVNGREVLVDIAVEPVQDGPEGHR